MFRGIIYILCACFWVGGLSAEARTKNKKDAAKKKGAAVFHPSPARTSSPDALPVTPISGGSMSGIGALPVLTSNFYLGRRYLEGIDVSRYQGVIDWKAVARSRKISYAYMKATEGESLVDRMYRKNIVEARQAGIRVGSYHFYRPNVNWKRQVENMLKTVKPEEQDLVPIVDIEVRGRVNHEKFIRDLKQFISEVERFYGKKPLLYTYHNFYNKHLVGYFHGYHWMIARYREDAPTLNDGTDFIMWQYTASGEIEGVRGDVDRSCIMEGFRLYIVDM